MNKYVRYVKQPAKRLASQFNIIVMELTERCNNDCNHCCVNLPANDRKAENREMTTEQVQAILKEAAALGCLNVRFTGGEPLLRPDFEELYLFARQLGFRVSLLTNGCLITSQLAGLFASIPPFRPIEITVYGMHPESYEAVSMVPGSFAQFRRGVDHLLESKVPFIVKGALMPPNLHEVDEFEAWAATIPWMKKKPGYVLFFALRYRRDNEERNQRIKMVRLAPEDGINILSRDWDRYHKDKEMFAAKYMGPTGNKLFTCGAGEGLYIDAYGRAQPCVGIKAPELTVDVLNGGLAAVPGYFGDLCKIQATNPYYLKRCAVCGLKGLCEQCPAKSWAENGTLDTPVDYFCEVAHAHARRLGWLGENEYGWQDSVQRGLLQLKEGQ